ncbi:MAG TPA: XRE family transcriptional regulator [Gaiellaceae bacterium]|jgi:transcriptional regulator with XRE-family HTH domain|nr:XRE family transcriptional regulator [Gaiellaceae bacterium]
MVDVPVGSRLRALRKERGMTIPQLAAATDLTNGFISQLERDLTSASLSSLARIAAALDVRLGHLVDGTPEGEAQKVLMLRGQEHVLLTSSDELRFHVTESRINPGGTAGEQLYSLPADVEIVYVAEGALELQVGDTVHRLETGHSLTYSPRDPHTWRNPSETEPAVVLWLAVPNPYARL